MAAIAGAHPFRRAARSVPRISRFAVVVFEGSQRFLFCPVANGAGIGLFARRCAGGRFGHFAFVPGVFAFFSFSVAAGILFPVLVFIPLPAAQGVGVVIRVRLTARKGIRALGPADAGLVIHGRRFAVCVGLFISVSHKHFIIGVPANIVFALADRALLPVLGVVSCPFAGPVVLARDEGGGAAADDRADGNSVVVFVPEFLGIGIVLVS